MFQRRRIKTSMKDICAKIQEADAIVIGAGAGLLRLLDMNMQEKDLIGILVILKEKYGIHDMYSGCFILMILRRILGLVVQEQVYYNRYV